MSALRVAVRTLGRRRWFTAIAVLSLGVAIALNTTMYGVVATLLASRLGVRMPERVYSLQFLGDAARVLPPATVEEALRAGIGGYEAVSGTRAHRTRRDGAQPVAEHGSRYMRVRPSYVRPDFFEFLGKRPVQGRTFLPGDEGSGAAVISDRLARRLFDGRSALGRGFLLDGDPLTVIGVVERYAGYEPLSGDVWRLRPAASPEIQPSLIRLRDMDDLENVKQELAVVASRLAMAAGSLPHEARFWIRPIPVTRQLAQFHKGMMAAVVAVLLVACANLANLQLARGLARARDLAVRAAVGASRGQLVRHLLLESGVLAAAGLTLGVVLTLWGIAAIRAYIPPEIDGYFVAPQVSWGMFAFASLAALACLFLVGLLPALHVSRVDPNVLLKGGAGTGATRAHRRRYGVLVIAQIAFALPVLIGAVVALKGAWRMHSGDYMSRERFGYDPRPVVIASVNANDVARPAGVSSVTSMATALAERTRRVPNVVFSAASIDRTPAGRMVTVSDEGGGIRQMMAHQWSYNAVTPDYFRVYGRRMAVGRDFNELDERAVVMDAWTARYLWGRHNPVGRGIKLAAVDSNAPWYTVVGVLDDMRDTFTIRRRYPDANFRLYGVYRLLGTPDTVLDHSAPWIGARQQTLAPRIELHARVSGNTELAAIRLQRELRDVSPNDRPTAVPLLWWLSGLRLQKDWVASLFAIFALVGITLVSIGVFGIVAHSVEERRRELAVRISLGATARNVLRDVLREGNVLILAGTAMGLLVIREAAWWLGPFVDQDVGYDALLFAWIAAGLFALAVASALVPAWRATRVDPVDALRHE